MATTAHVEARTFRDVLGHLPTGACVVTSRDALGKPVGLSCNSFTSVSLAPPLVSFCPSKSSTTWPLMRPSGHFAVNVLAEGQTALCLQFARHGIDRFADVDWRDSGRGNPLLKGVLAWLECEMLDEHDAGDHTIVVAAVHELEGTTGTGPLIFFRGRYARLRLD
jgi:3-hydroxy-9,10-secoandrosta-1,3,5(10)-triene-9,17-dione monooxygenase reductase component